MLLFFCIYNLIIRNYNDNVLLFLHIREIIFVKGGIDAAKTHRPRKINPTVHIQILDFKSIRACRFSLLKWSSAYLFAVKRLLITEKPTPR